ncbi:hypothetical protein EB052_00085, partial [bacterium]|nr:hypothetical protein [bacterium]
MYLAGGSSNWGTGGIGNALTDVSESNVVIRDTSFVGNKEYDILNMTKEMIDARNNAWENDLPKIYGPVDTSGTTTATTTTTIGASSSRCCSNVLFLPGIQASRLYVDEGKIGQSKQSENRLWEPNRNDDA